MRRAARHSKLPRLGFLVLNNDFVTLQQLEHCSANVTFVTNVPMIDAQSPSNVRVAEGGFAGSKQLINSALEIGDGVLRARV